ncbi:MAG: extensin family protein [Hyphomicrobiales bacterium]
MRRVLTGLGFAVMAAALVACSGGHRKERQQQERAEPIPPPACAVDPRQFAEAEYVGNFGSSSGCGVRNAWKLYSVNGVKLNPPAVVNCATANTFSQWISRSLQPAAQDHFGMQVTALGIPSAYACRTRNNVRGAKLSEHAHGNALDVSAFTFESGDKVTVEQAGFPSRRLKAFIAQIRAACGPFKTVLGPGVAYHKDHLHFDLQRHRNGGTYCR